MQVVFHGFRYYRRQGLLVTAEVMVGVQLTLDYKIGLDVTCCYQYSLLNKLSLVIREMSKVDKAKQVERLSDELTAARLRNDTRREHQIVRGLIPRKHAKPQMVQLTTWGAGHESCTMQGKVARVLL